MEQVIVIDHGDAGGVRLIDGRIVPIPPLEPGLSAQLRATNALLRAAEQAEEKAGEETAKRLGRLAHETAHAAVGELRDAVGHQGGAVIVHGPGGGLVADEPEGGDEPHSLIRLIRVPWPWPWPPNPEEILRRILMEREQEMLERAEQWQGREIAGG